MRCSINFRTLFIAPAIKRRLIYLNAFRACVLLCFIAIFYFILTHIEILQLSRCESGYGNYSRLCALDRFHRFIRDQLMLLIIAFRRYKLDAGGFLRDRIPEMTESAYFCMQLGYGSSILSII
jgi:hypothetical protein